MSQTIESLHTRLAILQAELGAARQENFQLQEKLSAALDGTGLCIWQGEPQSGKLTVFNLQNFTAGDMAPNFDLWLDKLHPQDKEAVLTSYYHHLAGLTPCYEAEYRTIDKHGRITWLWDRGRILERDSGGHPVRIMGAHVDITRRKEYEDQLAQLAHIDPLTGLVNRRHLMERLKQENERALRHADPFVLCMLDVDHFKRFNDAHGHDVGDQVLVEVARVMTHSLREYDICGRWGGEEFLLLLPSTTQKEAEHVIARMHHDIRLSGIMHKGKSLSITASIGLTTYRNGENFAETLRRADHALLDAKHRGRDRILVA